MKTTLDINDFFNPNGLQEYLRAPIRIDGRVLASTDHICIVMDDDDSAVDCHDDKLENITKILNMINADHAWVPMPANLVMPEKHTCKICNEIGTATVTECKECEGEGEVELENDYNSYTCECKTCDGDGSIIKTGGTDKCKKCNGEGMLYNKKDYVTILGVHVNPNYLNLIVNVPGIEIAGYPEKRELHFKLGDTRGLIMGIQQ